MFKKGWRPQIGEWYALDWGKIDSDRCPSSHFMQERMRVYDLSSTPTQLYMDIGYLDEFCSLVPIEALVTENE